MSTKQQLTESFYLSYHVYPLSTMANAIRDFLVNEPSFDGFRDNRHYQYLLSEMNRHLRAYKESPAIFPVELPGMVYGFYCCAWDKLLADIVSVR